MKRNLPLSLLGSAEQRAFFAFSERKDDELWNADRPETDAVVVAVVRVVAAAVAQRTVRSRTVPATAT
jgi:hypothetical protein